MKIILIAACLLLSGCEHLRDGMGKIELFERLERQGQ